MATKVIKQNNRGLTLRQQNILRMKEELNKPDEKALHPFTKYKIITYFFSYFISTYCDVSCLEKGFYF